MRLPALTPAGAAATAARSTPATAAAGVGLRFGLVHRDRAAVQFGAIQALDRGLGFGVVAHRDERKPAGAAGVAVRDPRHFLDLSMGRELILQRFLRCGKGKVDHIKFHRSQLRNYEFIPRSLESYE